ncbi:MAG TPA: site-specific integrase [Chloroflexia bacterium]|nr:site-specific integrase [Chloroflexia bacterium]
MATRRGHGEGMIRQRTDGVWEARIDLGYVEGKRRRKSIYGKTRREVAEKLKALLVDQQKGLPITTSERQTLGQFLEQWLADVARPTLRASTYATYENHVHKHLVPTLGRTPLQQLGPQQIQSLINQKLKTGLAPRTVADIHAVLRTALAQALKWGLVARNVATLVDRPRISQHQISFMTPEQARSFLQAIHGDRLQGLYTIAISLGLRRGEALGLRWEDVDFERGTITVKRGLQRIGGKLSTVELKTRASYRSINLPSVTLGALRAHRIRQLEERLLAGSRWQDTGHVFTTTIGTPIEPRNYKRSFDMALKHAGLDHMRIHDMRHTAASLLLAQDVSPKMISEILGHARVGITLDIYSHLYAPMRQDAAHKMDEVLAPGSYQEAGS